MDLISKNNEAREIVFADPKFNELMTNRILKVLIYCSNYDFYMLEEDGRIDEQIFDEYVQLNLREPPLFIHASTSKKAFEVLKGGDIDLVITMLSIDKSEVLNLINNIKNEYPETPIVALTPFSREVSIKLRNTDLSSVDYVFSWLGDAEILLAIIKLIEDKKNLKHDVEEVGVQTILLVEDSIRFYSSYLPIMYKIVLKQARRFMIEGLNDHREMLLMRGRPKILLATNYEQAISIYKKYSENMIGIISDVAYKRNGVKDSLAGFKLVEEILNIDEFAQCILQSSDISNREIAESKKIEFLYKQSKTLHHELAEIMFRKMAFGDFVFYNPRNYEEISRASDLKGLQDIIMRISPESLRHHFNRNDFSRWLNARALFPIAQLLKPLRAESFTSMEDAREYIHNTIALFRLARSRGVIAKFERRTYDKYLIFSRLGNGSLGGKARGLAFIDSFLKKNEEIKKFKDIVITIPRTVVLSTDIFDEFMNTNRLYPHALSDVTDKEILDRFVAAKLSKTLVRELTALLNVSQKPLAIRSSSVLEDSHYQPFAGIYSTYMIPRDSNTTNMIRILQIAIKSVYASVYFKSSKAYMEATSNLIAEEKMAIIIQEVCGTEYNNMFYPHISGVARSINFYPIPPEKNNEGIVKIAFGLGKSIVDGGVTLRFSPKYPKKIIQLSSPQMALKSTQKQFYALDLNINSFQQSVDDSVNILKLPITDADTHGSLKNIASTYDSQNQILRDGVNYDGKKLITFANILKNNKFPLAEILSTLLEIGQKEMNNPIEIEFAVDLNNEPGKPQIFNFLQIRPIVENYEEVNFNFNILKPQDMILHSKSALGNGTIPDIVDLIYVKPKAFNPAKTLEIANLVTRINEKFTAEKKYYILIGPGRWGSSDPWLGIPVKWPQISHARLIVESGLANFRIDPSQGTHFFQNLTSFRVGYFTVNPYINDGAYDVEYLDSLVAIYEDAFVRHIRFATPLVIKIDGKRNEGVVCKPHIDFNGTDRNIINS